MIGGLQKTTLIDFPGRLACTVFTIGCNFRCPFCHNKDLVSLKNFRRKGLKELSEDSFFDFLKKRKKILEGVCITGGEPTIQPDLVEFCQKIKDLGLEVKLDTNGSNPKLVEQLIKNHLLDFIAMDIKSCFADYPKATAVSFPLEEIKRSINLILKSGLEYEFRTTVVPGIHHKKNLIKLAKELKNFSPKLSWVLQQFQPKNCLDPKYLKVKPFSKEKMEEILKSLQMILPKTKMRGVN